MKKFLVHYFFPHESNSYRAKMLHHKSILVLIIVLFLGSFFLSFLKTNYPSVLGISSNITLQELLILTNREREANGLPALQLNNELSLAAENKASNMFSENYWSHESPSGVTPWFFIKNAGYNYIHAGENLARGFTNTQEVINAWMASPTHKKNILSSNYKEIGFAIRTGTLSGEETVLVVEMFGARSVSQPATAVSKPEIAVASNVTNENKDVVAENKEPLIQEREDVNDELSQSLGLEINKDFKTQLSAAKNPAINSVKLSSNVLRIIVGLFILSLFLDMIIIERRKIVRFFGHNVDHILFLSLVLILISFLIKGVIV